MRKASFSILLTASACLVTTAVRAQVTFGIGPKVGYNLVNVRYRDADAPDQRADYRSGLEAGVIASLGWGHFAVQPGVLYSQRGFVLHQAGAFYNTPYLHHTSARLDYLMLPLNVAYTQHANGQGAQVFAGVYLGVLAGGYYQSTVTSYYGPNQPPYESTTAGNVRVGDPQQVSASNLYGRRFDNGVQLGLGYRYHGLLAQASYSLGLRDVDTYNSSAYYIQNFASYNRPSYRNQAFQVSLAYLVGTKS